MSNAKIARNVNLEKRHAAEKSLEYVRDGMHLGLGSGSTAAIMIELLAQRVREGLRIQGIPTSEGTRHLAHKLGIPLLSFDSVLSLDLTIDGADEADDELNLIKGGGGAMLREKIIASVSRHVIIIVDSSKRCRRLGAFPLPVEVVQFSWRPIAERIRALGSTPVLRMTPYGQPFVTDEGNYILDCPAGEIADPASLSRQLHDIPGVMEHGLFVGLASTLIVGHSDRVEVLERDR